MDGSTVFMGVVALIVAPLALFAVRERYRRIVRATKESVPDIDD